MVELIQKRTFLKHLAQIVAPEMQPVPPGKKVFNPNYVALSWSRQLIMPAICQRGCHWQLHGVPQLMIFFIQFCNVTASIAVTVI